MIELDIKYSGGSVEGKPVFIILHNTSFDICTPDYKGGSVRTIDYSSVKNVCASGGDLIIKILRTEVVLRDIGSEDVNGLAQVIEIGRNEPIEHSKAYSKYKKTAQKAEDRAERRQERAEQRAERRQERVEKFSAVVDSINRYREQSREQSRAEEREEQERQEKEDAEKQQRIAALEKEIEQQVVNASDTEETALSKILKLNRLHTKCQASVDYADLNELVMDICKDNISVLKMSYPDSDVTAKAEEQLEQFIQKKKKNQRGGYIGCILMILGIIAFFVLCYLLDYFYPKK